MKRAVDKDSVLAQTGRAIVKSLIIQQAIILALGAILGAVGAHLAHEGVAAGVGFTLLSWGMLWPLTLLALLCWRRRFRLDVDEVDPDELIPAAVWLALGLSALPSEREWNRMVDNLLAQAEGLDR